MLNSPRRGISYPNPDRSDRPDVPAHFLNVINALEIDMIYAQGTDAARQGRTHLAGVFFWTTDTGAAWYDDGTTWHQTGAGTTINTYANRPAANTVTPGTRFFATDTLGTWYSDGSTWTLISQGTPRISTATFASTPWTTPYDNMKVALQIDATAGVYWVFQYNSSSASAYKWEFVGGPDLYSEVTTLETTASSTYVALTTPGPSIILPRAGDYKVEHGSTMAVTGGAGGPPLHSYDIGATGAVDGDAVYGSSGGLVTSSRVRLKAGLTAIQLTSKYKNSGANTANYRDRWMRVAPIRIS